MSTSYYALRSPVARLSPVAEQSPTSAYHLLDSAGAWLGTVAGEALHLATGRELTAHRSNDRIAVYATGSDATQVISEYGELTTLGELRAGRGT